MSFNRLSKKLGFSIQSEVSQPQVVWGKSDSWCNQDTHSNFCNKTKASATFSSLLALLLAIVRQVNQGLFNWNW